MSARVAVIVPAYNRADLLPEALESVLGQSFDDWRVIVVDDASDDDTHAVAQGFERRDPRYRAIRLERNAGVGNARNVGLEAARGSELVCLLDHDDYMLDECLAELVSTYDRASAAGRRVGVVSANALLLTSEGMTGETWFDRNGRVPRVTIDRMIRRNCLQARALFPLALLPEVGGGFSPECRGSDDYDLWMRILEAGYEGLTIERPLFVYRDHPGAFSRNQGARAEGKIASYERALGRGALDRAQRRAVRAQLRHFRAIRARERALAAARRSRPLPAIGLALRAAPLLAVAVLQAPGRWRAWGRSALRGAARRDRAVNGG